MSYETYYAIQNDYINSLSHFGRKGMKWGQHIFGKEEISNRLRGWLDNGLSGERASTLLNQSRRTQIANQVDSWIGRGKTLAGKTQSSVSLFKKKTMNTLGSISTETKKRGRSKFEEIMAKLNGDELYYDDNGAHRSRNISSAQALGMTKVNNILKQIGGRSADYFREQYRQTNITIQERTGEKFWGKPSQMHTAYDGMQSIRDFMSSYGQYSYSMVFGELSDPKYRVKIFD